MASGLGRSLSLTVARHGRVCRQVSFLGCCLHVPLPGLARLDTWVERLAFIVWRYGSQILNLLHFALLLDLLLDYSLLLAQIGRVLSIISLFGKVLRGIFFKFMVDEFGWVALIHPVHQILTRFLLSLMLALDKFIGIILLKAVARVLIDRRVLVVGRDVEATVDFRGGTFLEVLIGHGSLFFNGLLLTWYDI